MNIWYAIRREAAAAWRSLRYDLHRLTGDPRHGVMHPEVVAEAPTTDLSRAKVVEPYADHSPQRRRGDRQPTRLRPAVSVAVLTVALAGVTYLGVLQGLAALTDRTSPVSSLPVVEGEGRIGVAPTPSTQSPVGLVPPVPVWPDAPPPATATASPLPTPTPPTESTQAPTPDPSASPGSPSPTQSATPPPSPDPTNPPPTSPPTTRPADPSQPADPGRASAS